MTWSRVGVIDADLAPSRRFGSAATIDIAAARERNRVIAGERAGPDLEAAEIEQDRNRPADLVRRQRTSSIKRRSSPRPPWAALMRTISAPASKQFSKPLHRTGHGRSQRRDNLDSSIDGHASQSLPILAECPRRTTTIRRRRTESEKDDNVSRTGHAVANTPRSIRMVLKGALSSWAGPIILDKQ